MAGDIYVMPLWRFKDGDFSSPAERAFHQKPMTVGGMLGNQLGISARERVDALRKDVAAKANVRIEWRDEGDIHYREQNYGFDTLRAYARWADYEEHDGPFVVPDDRNYSKHPVWRRTEKAPALYPHIANHSLYTGYLLPCEFRGIYDVEPYTVGTLRCWQSVGSSLSVCEEVERLSDHLELPEKYVADQGDPLGDVKWFTAELRKITRLSMEYKLPVIFYA